MPGMTDSRQSEHRLHRRVQFYEVDSAGIVHFSWFFRYMEEAEHALWRAAGLSIAAPDAEVGFPRVATSFDFRRPLRFEDEFDIHIKVAAIGRKSMRYACDIVRHGEQLATGSLTIACVTRAADRTIRAVPIPDAIASRFAVAEPSDDVVR
jgi:acyl-CoA thioester hydrolase